jgi:hypothetical protein
MHLDLGPDRLTIDLDPWERVWSLRFRPLSFAREHVLSAEPIAPSSSWRDLRLPGTFLPGVIKAGSYYTPRGWEFWYILRETASFPLSLRLENERFRAVVLGIENNVALAERISAWIAADSDSNAL